MGASQCSGYGAGSTGWDCCAASKTTCCKAQGKDAARSRLHQAPEGFTYYNPTTKEVQNYTLAHRAADWNRTSSSFNSKKGETLIVGHILESLTHDRSSSDYSSRTSKSDWSVQSGRGSFRQRTWKQEIPPPLPDWTKEEQQALIDVLDDYPRAGRDDSQLELAIVHAKKMLPHRTGEDCYRCFLHIKDSRVAVFSKPG